MGLISNLKRDWVTLSGLMAVLKHTNGLGPDNATIFADDLERSMDRHRANVAFRFEGEIMTYAELEALANKVANWALGEGLKAGDAVALFMENRPEYVAIWFGLAKIGVVTGLINHNLAGQALAHCVNIASAKALIMGPEQREQLESGREHFDGDLPVWSLGAAEGAQDLDAALAEASDVRPDRSHREHLRGKDLCLYVYTSGTTGLPKAAKLTQTRAQGMSRTFVTPTGTTARDRIYITLPLYHGTGGVCGVGIALNTGASIILRRKFSARQFWDDVTDQGATVFVYIGELCRYLLNQPPHPKERAHRLRMGFGNGLRPEIWAEFLERFKVPDLCEFYGSTEGNVTFMNFDNQVGAVGRIPKFLEKKFDNIGFVKFDIETEQPVRGPDGFCIPADPNEPAEVLGRIGDEARTRFEGYNDPEATKKKLLKDVFETGDMWFRTGDLMRKDEHGYIYFVDRIGDTFRWKGENVSTNEVGEALSSIDGIAHANVYGVPIAGMDGKAGMAAITPDGDIDFAALKNALAANLPPYAVPVFLRLQREAETTGTFKYRKVELVQEGFDPDKVSDPVWFAHPDKKEYVPLTHDIYESILSGGFRF
ncbi:MAG: long-chain-acyl-CoA synthetase [Pseudomonadota bacterium]